MMIYKIELLELPKILFAHTSQLDDPSPVNSAYRASKRLLEFVLVEKGDIHLHQDDGSVLTVPENSVGMLTALQNFHVRISGTFHHSIDVQSLGDFSIVEVSEKDVIDYYSRPPVASAPYTFFAPAAFPPGPHLTHIKKLFYKLVFSWTDLDGTREMECLGMLLQLYAEISRVTLQICLQNTGDRIAPSGEIYVQRAIQYIHENLHRHISVTEIANELHISSHYLGALFKNSLGQTPVEYINTLKIEKVKELLSIQQMTLRQAAEQVGVSDVNYLSRLFRKYAGITVREFRLPLEATKAKVIDPHDDM